MEPAAFPVSSEENELPGYSFFYSTTGTTSAANWTEVGYAGTENDPGGIPAPHLLCLPNFTAGTTMTSAPVNIVFATPLTNNGVMHFRWADDDAVTPSPDAMIAIDDISITTYTPAGPTVSITSPANGSSVGAGSITIQASTSDTTGSVTNVAYFSGIALLGNATTAPFSFTWTGLTAGSYSLTAQATDDSGLMATSSVVSVTVTNPLVASFAGSYTENFDQDLTNSTTLMPAGFQAMYLSGSHFTYTNGVPIDSNAIATATSGSGASTLIVWNADSPVTDASYQLFNIGCWDSLTDRAIGTDPTGTAGTVIQLALTNNTGSALNGVTFSYTEKCLTNGATSNGSYTDDGTERLELPGYAFFYSITGDNNPANWYSVDALSLTNWVQGTSSDSGPVTIAFPTPLPANGVMYFRWADDNTVSSSPDQMYAIDNISVTTYNPNGPVVSITSPTNSENYIPYTGIITVNLNTSDTGSTITNVALYFAGSNTYTYNLTSDPYTLTTAPGDIAPGSYTLTAVASDAAGLVATSSVVNITVAFVPPTVSLTSPSNGDSFPAPASIPMSALADSADGTVASVAFYSGTTLLANVDSAPFNYTWANVSAGSYNLTALATDDKGLTATSSVVSVTVTNGYGTPLASITSPANNVNYLPGSNIAISANAIESGGTITNVEFYANSTDLGGVSSAPYTLTWPGVPAGSYALTAVASDLAGNSTTSSVVNITVNVPPTVSLTAPANNATFAAPATIAISAAASDTDGTVTNVAFYQGSTLLANDTTAPYSYSWTNVSAGAYALAAVATDNSGVSTTSSVVNVTVTNTSNLAVLQQIKTFFIIPLENHDWVQKSPTGSPEQIFTNPAAPYVNSLVTPGNSNAVQVSYATHYFSCAINGEHPSEPNYVWSEAGTDFGVRTDNDPTSGNNQWSNVQHLSGQLTAAGIAWKTYQEDVEYSSSEETSASGTGKTNPYNGTTQYSYAVKHNPMAFFTDTQNKNCYPLTNFWADLTNGNIGQYNWITPDQYNEMHSSLPSGYTYHGTAWTGDQAAIAEGDNFLSIVIPKIMASAAYKSNGVIIIWTDETESTDDTNTTLPFIIISPLAKGNAYASTLAYSHSSDLKTMDEIFGLAYQTNAIPSAESDAQNDGKYNYVNASSATINDLSDFFTSPPTAPTITVPANITVEATNAAGDVVNFTATATDSVDGALTPAVTPASGSTFPLGTNIVTVTTTNSGGLSATNTFLVIVQDTTPPVITVLGANPFTNFQSVAFVDPGATAYDVVSGSVPVAPNGTVDANTLGTYTVDYTASDAAGNSATNTRTVQVVAIPVPVNLNGAAVSSGGSSGAFQLSFGGAIGQPYRILGTDDLSQPMTNWTVLASGTVTNNPVTFTDLGVVTNATRYYRIVSP